MREKIIWSHRLFIILFFVIIILGVGCGNLPASERAEVTKLATDVVANEYEMATMETVFDDFSIQIDNIEDLLNGKVIGVVYFGRDTCPFCLTLNGILKKEMEAMTDICIYKFDTDVWREDERFQEVLDKYMIDSIPALIRINVDLTFERFIPNKTESDEEVQQSLRIFLTE